MFNEWFENRVILDLLVLRDRSLFLAGGVGRVHMEFHDISYGPPFILNVSCSAPLCNTLYTCDPPFSPMHGSIHMSNIVRSDDVGHCKLHLGVWVCWKPPSEFRSEPWWDPGGKTLEPPKKCNVQCPTRAKRSYSWK